MERVALAVIGGGVAGVAAALAARRAGLDVVLVRRAPGASALGGGGWRGPLAAPLADALGAGGLAHEPVSHPLPHPDGELRAFDYAPRSHAAAVIETGACVIGIEGFPTYRATALAGMWGHAARAELVAAHVHLPDTPAAGWGTASLAHAIAADPRPLGDALRETAARTNCTRFVLPAVLGTSGVEQVRAAIEHAAGVPVGEALGTAPSLPGLRLVRAFENALAAAGVTLVEGRVVDVHDEGAGVTTLEVLPTGAASSIRITAGACVLATGRFTGGGIVADPQFVETVFGAPVGVDHLGEQFEEADPLALTDPVRTEPQPLLAAGVRVAAGNRLLGTRAASGAQNLYAAGAVRAGLEDGLGFAALDGERAVEGLLSADRGEVTWP